MERWFGGPGKPLFLHWFWKLVWQVCESEPEGVFLRVGNPALRLLRTPGLRLWERLLLPWQCSGSCPGLGPGLWLWRGVSFLFCPWFSGAPCASRLQFRCTLGVFSSEFCRPCLHWFSRFQFVFFSRLILVWSSLHHLFGCWLVPGTELGTLCLPAGADHWAGCPALSFYFFMDSMCEIGHLCFVLFCVAQLVCCFLSSLNSLKCLFINVSVQRHQVPAHCVSWFIFETGWSWLLVFWFLLLLHLILLLGF